MLKTENEEARREQAAAIKIQNAARARFSRVRASRMRSTKAKLLTFLEGPTATFFAVLFVAVVIFTEMRYATEYPVMTLTIGYVCSFYFLTELSVRFDWYVSLLFCVHHFFPLHPITFFFFFFFKISKCLLESLISSSCIVSFVPKTCLPST